MTRPSSVENRDSGKHRPQAGSYKCGAAARDERSEPEFATDTDISLALAPTRHANR